jgi:amino acid transporter
VNKLFRKKAVSQAISDTKGLEEHPSGGMKRTLGLLDLTAFGIAAVVGAGIFSTIGKASFEAGPGIILLFIFVAIACGFSALCYAEFASLVPASGSAYTYSYVAFGEIIAWIIGWDLIMEYAIGNIVVAISWSGYFASLCKGFGVHIPAYLLTDFWAAKEGINETAIAAWSTAPEILGFKVICNIPAFFIVVVIAAITYIGIKESKKSANAMVLLKVGVVLLVIFAGAFYVKPENWTPFLPNGFGGILGGITSVFFAYIGFDAISTTAEECKDPQRDLPKSMMLSLAICTVLYVAIALVLTGMVNYSELNVSEPLSFVFEKIGWHWMAGLIAVSAVIATASVLLVFQVGQPRIWMSMSRDGLLPKRFSTIHPKFGTPSFATIVAGFLVAVPALFANMDLMVDLTSIGTLFAFALVSAGVMRMHAEGKHKPSFKVTYINSKWIYPIALFISVVFIGYYDSSILIEYLGLHDGLNFYNIRDVLPHYFFVFLCLYLLYYAVSKNASFIPMLALLTCSYLLSESGARNWERFILWLLIGIVIYFFYGKNRSKLA